MNLLIRILVALGFKRLSIHAISGLTAEAEAHIEEALLKLGIVQSHAEEHAQHTSQKLNALATAASAVSAEHDAVVEQANKAASLAAALQTVK